MLYQLQVSGLAYTFSSCNFGLITSKGKWKLDTDFFDSLVIQSCKGVWFLGWNVRRMIMHDWLFQSWFSKLGSNQRDQIRKNVPSSTSENSSQVSGYWRLPCVQIRRECYEMSMKDSLKTVWFQTTVYNLKQKWNCMAHPAETILAYWNTKKKLLSSKKFGNTDNKGKPENVQALCYWRYKVLQL